MDRKYVSGSKKQLEKRAGNKSRKQCKTGNVKTVQRAGRQEEFYYPHSHGELKIPSGDNAIVKRTRCNGLQDSGVETF
jgi:hypothetical protein